jgi:hypothetical protein
VLPPGGHAFGQTYSQWAASWWQWALPIPADISPLNDPTGANAAQEIFAFGESVLYCFADEAAGVSW